MKSIKQLSWDVTEETYRADSAISYSALSSFAREGPKIVPYLYEKKDSKPLRFGSLVDCLMTEPDTLNDRFFISNFPSISDALIKITNNAWEKYHNEYRSISKIPFDNLLLEINLEGYYTNWKPETRVKDVVSKCEDYYNLLSQAGNKIVMSTDDYLDAYNCVNELKTNDFTQYYFNHNPFETNIEREFQLKFWYENSSLPSPIRCMFDLILVDHENKTIRPCDLKTTGKEEEKFDQSFISWNYYLQSTMYSYILQRRCQMDPYFKDFTILPFTFIVINRKDQAPVIWEDEDNLIQGSRYDKFNNEYKSWQDLLIELTWHFNTKIYNYSYDTYHAKGIKKLKCLTVNDRK